VSSRTHRSVTVALADVGETHCVDAANMLVQVEVGREGHAEHADMVMLWQCWNQSARTSPCCPTMTSNPLKVVGM